MSYSQVTLKITSYDAVRKSILVLIKTDVCKKSIDEYDPINFDLATASVPYDLDAALKDIVNSSHLMLLHRHQAEAVAPSILAVLDNTVYQKINQELAYAAPITTKTIPAPVDDTVEDPTNTTNIEVF